MESNESLKTHTHARLERGQKSVADPGADQRATLLLRHVNIPVLSVVRTGPDWPGLAQRGPMQASLSERREPLVASWPGLARIGPLRTTLRWN